MFLKLDRGKKKMKVLTTNNKKVLVTASLVIVAWYALIMNGNPLSLPSQPAFITNPLLAGFSLLHLSVVGVIMALVMLWEY